MRPCRDFSVSALFDITHDAMHWRLRKLLSVPASPLHWRRGRRSVSGSPWSLDDLASINQGNRTTWFRAFHSPSDQGANSACHVDDLRTWRLGFDSPSDQGVDRPICQATKDHEKHCDQCFEQARNQGTKAPRHQDAMESSLSFPWRSRALARRPESTPATARIIFASSDWHDFDVDDLLGIDRDRTRPSGRYAERPRRLGIKAAWSSDRLDALRPI